MRRILPALGVAAVAAIALPASAAAATIEVTSTEEPGVTLGEAILRSDPGDTIAIPDGEHLLVEGDVAEANELTLRGAGEGVTTIVPSGGGETVEPGSGVTVVDATVGAPLQPETDDDSGLDTKVQIVALIGTLALFLLVLDLVRRRRLAERYALLWMAASAALLVLAVWRGGLDAIADLMGVAEPANAIFILAFGVAFLLLLNFSVATTRLSEETKILAQETARLEQELRGARGQVPGGNGASGVAEEGSEEPARERSDAGDS